MKPEHRDHDSKEVAGLVGEEGGRKLDKEEMQLRLDLLKAHFLVRRY